MARSAAEFSGYQKQADAQQSKTTEIPAAALTSFVRSIQATEYNLDCAAHDMSCPNKLFSSIMAISISFNRKISMDLGYDNPHVAISHGTASCWRLVATVLLSNMTKGPFSIPEESSDARP